MTDDMDHCHERYGPEGVPIGSTTDYAEGDCGRSGKNKDAWWI